MMGGVDDVSALDWVERVLGDLTYRSPFGVVWEASSESRPVEVEVGPADHPRIVVALSERGDISSAVAAFAAEVQEQLTPVFAGRVGSARNPAQMTRWVPACPLHDHALVAVGGGPAWVCPEGSWSCPVGGYEDSFWPFGPDARSDDVQRGIHRHLRAAGVGWSGSSQLERQGDDWVYVVSPQMRDDSPEAVATLAATMSEAVAPVKVRVESVVPLRTVRYRTEAEKGPPFRPGREGLGTTGWSQWALIQGVLRRPGAGEDCDVVVEGSPGHRTWVRLGFDHQTTAAGSSFLLDEAGEPFADEGDV
ncbi:MAG: hypothetical protein ACRD0J_09975, partial [Acidimicrobiales bacterium]